MEILLASLELFSDDEDDILTEHTYDDDDNIHVPTKQQQP